MDYNPIPAYKTAAGIQVYTVEGANKRPRAVPLDQLGPTQTIFLVAHFTESQKLDSRHYLWQNERSVSTTYLAGQWNGKASPPEIIKYGSERVDCMYTQGYGIVGEIASYDHGADWNDDIISVHMLRNFNDRGIGYEIEGFPTPVGMPSTWLIDAVTSHIAEIIVYWHKLGKQVHLISHHIIDPEKQDPQLDFTMFTKTVYDKVRF